METYSEYLMHYGIKKMKWGKKNGPPYPLTDKQRSTAENAANPTSDSAKMLAKQGSDSRFNDTGAIKSLAEYRMQKAAAERKKSGWGIKTDEGNDVKDESKESIKEVDNRKYPTLSKKDNATLDAAENPNRTSKHVPMNETVNRNGRENLRDDQASYDQAQRMQRIKAGQQRESEKQRLRDYRENVRKQEEAKKLQQEYYDSLSRQSEKEAYDYWYEANRSEMEAKSKAEREAQEAAIKARLAESAKKGEEAAKKLQMYINEQEKPGPKGKSLSDDLREVSSMTLEDIKKYYPDKYDQIKKEMGAAAEEARKNKSSNSAEKVQTDDERKRAQQVDESILKTPGHLSNGERNRFGKVPTYTSGKFEKNPSNGKLMFTINIMNGAANSWGIDADFLKKNYPDVYDALSIGRPLTIDLVKKYPNLYRNLRDALGYNN